MPRSNLAAIAGVAALLFATLAGHAQLCVPRWSADFPNQSISGLLLDGIVFDDGRGPALFVAGGRLSVGPYSALGIARWDSAAWEPLTPPAMASSNCSFMDSLAIYDDGDGPALYAGGTINNCSTYGGILSRWHNGRWATIALFGSHDQVFSLCTHDDGQGPALYVGGVLSSIAGGPPISRGVARYRHGQWSPVGAGIAGGTVAALASYDDGSGPSLIVGGRFTLPGSSNVLNVVRWNGQNWLSLGSGLTSTSTYPCVTLTVQDPGDGPSLYVGGRFTAAGGLPTANVARWNSAGWSALGAGLPGSAVFTIKAFDSGDGARLYAGGEFGTSNIAVWDGAAWSPVGSGVSGVSQPSVDALVPWHDSAGPALFVLGGFTNAGGLMTSNIATYSSRGWAVPPSGILGSYVDRLRVLDEGSGPAVYAGGQFQAINGSPANGVAQLSGGAWHGLGAGVAECRDIAVLHEAAGPRLYSTGTPALSRWNGSQWETVAASFGNLPVSLAVHDDGGGSAVYVGGGFYGVQGVPNTAGIARWDGASWSSVSANMGISVWTMLSVSDPLPAGLYAGGPQFSIGAGAFRGIARWDGSAWNDVGGGLWMFDPTSNSWANAMTIFDDGSGPALYVGGVFTRAGNVPALRIARWNGSAWSALGSGIGSPVISDSDIRALAVFDDGRGPALFAGGLFPTAGGNPANNIARWDGHVWTALNAGVNGAVTTLAAFDDGRGPALWVGGSFTTAGGLNTSRLARWVGCRGCYANCDASTTPPVLTIADFQCFMNRFGAADPSANCDGSTTPPALNVLDFICFLNKFAAGCP